MSDLSRFLVALGRHWKTLVTSSLLIAVLWVAQAWYTIPRWAYSSFGALAIVYAAFLAWRDECRRAESAERELKAERDVATADPGPVVADDIHWLLFVENALG